MRATRRPRPLIGVALLLTLVAIGLVAATTSRAYAADPLQPGTNAIVRADGDCLRVRDNPSLGGAVLACLPEDTIVGVLTGTTEADGVRWQRIESSGVTGWASDQYLQPTTSPQPTSTPVAPPTAAARFPEPPVGGLTLGIAGTTDPVALVAAQSFSVESVSVFDLATQRFFVYVPGAPPFASTLNSANLRASSIATLKRTGTVSAGTAPPLAAPQPAAGTANALPAPPAGGLTQGIAGTNDPAALATAQPFPVESISMLDVASQAWLVYIPGAPAIVNTLNSGSLSASAVVTLKSSGGATPPPTSTPPSTPPPAGGYTPAPPTSPGDGVPGPAANEPVVAAVLNTVHLTYYYCQQGSIRASIGDGGGFCGYFANGQRVHEGGAACTRAELGQRFRIHGDPNETIYTCKDTGGAVYAGMRDIWFADSDSGYLWWRAMGPTVIIEQVAAK